jgi:5-methylcytosine-specific restriction protein A
MYVISHDNKVLNSLVSIQEVDEVFGLVMESRGGARGKSNERNTDYFSALDTILKRLQDREIKSIKIHIVSSNALKIWSSSERILEVDGKPLIDLDDVDLKMLRGRISRAQQEKKADPLTKGGNPTKRILIEADLSAEEWKLIVIGESLDSAPIFEDEVHADSEEFDPKDIEEAKERVARSIALRRGQPKFRKKLLRAYESSCAVTGTSIPEVLEAAHIIPYISEKTNHVTNGILLRADIHTLFDLGLIGIDEHYTIVVAAAMKDSEYESYHGQLIRLPKNTSDHPNPSALKCRAIPSRD